ncbi:MAG: energy transducer TonB [Candidatus Binatia bacterium]|nr:energy transducer TonB [Candidatus Binatia bacterium]
MNLACKGPPELFGFPRHRWLDYGPWLAAAMVSHAILVWALSHIPVQVLPLVGEPPLRVTIVGLRSGGGAPPGGPAAEHREEAGMGAMRSSPDAGEQPPADPAPQRNHQPKVRRPAPARNQRAKVAEANTERSATRSVVPNKAEDDLGSHLGASEGSGGAGANAAGGKGEGNGGSGAAGGMGGRGGVAGTGVGDARAYCLRCPPPVYPVMARQRNWSGVVRVWLELAGDGTVRTARVEQSSGHEVLDREALAAAKNSRFRLPADASGRTTSGVIEYRFELVE